MVGPGAPPEAAPSEPGKHHLPSSVDSSCPGRLPLAALIAVADELGSRLAESLRQKMFDFMFMSNQQIAWRTIPARVVEGHQLHWIYMKQDGDFFLTRFPFAEWTSRNALIRIRVENKTKTITVFGGQKFSIRHEPQISTFQRAA